MCTPSEWQLDIVLVIVAALINQRRKQELRVCLTFAYLFRCAVRVLSGPSSERTNLSGSCIVANQRRNLGLCCIWAQQRVSQIGLPR